MMPGKLYEGTRSAYRTKVTVNGRPLALRLDLANHSPDGFEWGYGGSGPGQLALALLVDATGDEAVALRYSQEFKVAFVLHLAKPHWKVEQSAIQSWVACRTDMDAERTKR